VVTFSVKSGEEKEAILKRIDQYLTDPHLKSLPVDNNRML
jgi:hypothetical protein